MMRSARTVASAGWQSATCMTANSSPPMRAIVSVSRTSPRSRAVTILQQLVAGRMAQRIVDGLEVVEVEQVYRHHSAASGAGERVLEPLVEQHAVGEVRQRIVQGHVHDLGLGAALLGDVLVRGDDAAVAQALPGHGDAAAVGERADELAGVSVCGAVQHGLEYLLGRLAAAAAVGDPVLEDLQQRCARFHLLLRETIDLAVLIVHEDDALIRVEHGEPLDHVVQGGVEVQVLYPQRLFLLLEEAMLLLELRIEPLAVGDVLVRDDVCAVRA